MQTEQGDLLIETTGRRERRSNVQLAEFAVKVSTACTNRDRLDGR
jgi:hypothetical protein